MQTYAFDTNRVIEWCCENAVISVGVFGSMARGEANEYSDVDLLVEFRERKSLFDVARLKRELSLALGRPVDILTKNAISPYLRDRILSEVQTIYESR